MWVRIIVAVGLLGVAVHCGPAPVKCGDAICTAEQRCTASKTCVTDEPPVVKIAAPLEAMVVTTTMVTVNGTASDDDDGLVVDVSTNRQTWVPVKLGTDGSYSLQLALPMLDASAGQVTVRGKDSHGHVVQVSRGLQVDNVPPACAFKMPVDMAQLTTSGTMTVKMTASDGSLVLINPQFSSDGAATFTPPAANVNDFSADWSVGTENGISHELVFRVDDTNGHTCETRATVMVDNVKPTIAFSTPLSSSLLGVPFFTTQSGLVSGTASDGMRALKSVTLDFADGAGPRMAQLSLTGDHVWSVNVPKPPLDDYKAHAAVAVVTDLAGNTATASLNVTVDVKAPALSITSPTAGAKLNIASFPTNNNVQLTWVLTDGDPSPTISLVQADGGLVTPPTLPTSPTDNPKPYTATLKAVDRAGNSATAAVSFTVDRVAPTIVSTAPVNDTRMFVGPTSANFSEPMITNVDGLNLNPFAPGGTWTTPQHYEVGGLLKDTVYNAISGPATDLHGNPLASSSYRFHTETFTPGSGAQIAFGYVLVYEATADVEGTINIIAKRQSNNATEWLQINPSSGGVAVLDTNAYPTQAGLLSAARTINPNLSSRRLAGLTVNPGPSGLVRYSIDGAAPIEVAGSAQAFIPTPPLTGEGTGLAEFGVIAGGFYKRTGRSNVAISLSQVGAFNFSDTRWQVMIGNMGGTDSQDFACSPVCNLSGVKSLGGGSVGNPNAAISLSCSVHGYQAAGFEKTTLFRYQPGCGGTTNPCAPDITEDNNFDQVVADPLHDGTFYGFYTDGAGNYQVKKRVLSSATCAGTITNVGAPINIPLLSNQGTPQLVVIRGVPGFITPNANNNLIFVGP